MCNFLSNLSICYSVLNKNLLTVDEFDDLRLKFDLEVRSKIFINSAQEAMHYEQPLMTHTELHKSVYILISMQETESDDTIQTLSVNQRKCVYKDEKKLKYFNDELYSYSGCLKECKIDKSLEVCGCLPPFYRYPRFNNLTYCDFKSLKCLKDEKILKRCSDSDCELSCNYTTFTLENVQQE